MTTPTRDCVACRHWREGESNELRSFTWPTLATAVSQPFRKIDGHWFACLKGHKPHFYKPRYAGDFYWGWKRRCTEFEPRGGGK
jgi:hypothetical protein